MNFLDGLGCDNSVHCSGFSDQMAGNCGLPVPHAARVSVLQYPPALQYLGLALVPALTSFYFRLVDSCSSAVLQYPPALQYLGLVSLQQLSGSSSGTEQQHAVGDRFAAAVENKPYV